MTVAGAPRRATPEMVLPPRSPGRWASWVIIAGLNAVLLGVGCTLLLAVPSVRADQSAYAASTPYRCGHEPVPPAGVACWQGMDATLVQVDQGRTWTGARRTVVTVETPAGRRAVEVERAAAVDCGAAGDAVVLRTHGGSVSAVLTPHGVLPTAANPYVDADVVLDGGLTLMAAALIIPVGLALVVLRRRHSGEVRGPEVLWSSLPVRLAMLVFLLGQAADVVTSAIGQQRGLDEGNPLVDVFIRVAGPTGFLLYRLPAVILVLLGLTQVPRRAAVITLTGVGALFLLVGAHNAVLAAGTGASVVCGPPIALP